MLRAMQVWELQGRTKVARVESVTTAGVKTRVVPKESVVFFLVLVHASGAPPVP